MSTVTRRPADATSADALDVREVHLDDPLVRPLLEDLAHEYATRYSDHLTEEELLREMSEYPAADFAQPHGRLILVLAAGAPVAGGAYRRRTEPELGDLQRSAHPDVARTADGSPAVPTAELKRIWTHNAHRRRGLARLVLTELERRAGQNGYERIYLTTGPRQPEAAGLYLSAGYAPLYDPATQPGQPGPLAFEKWLCPR
jgi:ribosomal protein S18 acetylase RimI-like enzyme